MWGHLERATARVQMCRGSGCPVRVRADAGWIVRDGAAARARCGSTAGTTCVWPRREVGLEQKLLTWEGENTHRKSEDKEGEYSRSYNKAAQEQWSTAPPTFKCSECCTHGCSTRHTPAPDSRTVGWG